MKDDLLARAERWLAHDPDLATRAELGALIAAARAGDAAVIADLAERFTGPLAFGTAGLRGLLGAGESRMNRAVVLRTTAGLGHYLLAHDAPAARERGVAIGYDGRHLSREFAEDTACVLAAMGIPAHLSPKPCPTPLTAFAVTHLDAVAGVMVTASHNPPAYNGYKVYWQNGAQIIPPHDQNIAACIAAEPPADAVARTPIDEALAGGLVRMFSPSIEQQYLAAIAALSPRGTGDRAMPIVYTPLHGVGDELTRRALGDAGFTHVTTVPEQQLPDGDFPTVAFPNPEEKGALDLAFALADRLGADLVIANDPDVDRLAAAVRGGDGRFVQLTGNQVGVLLGHYLLTERGDAGADRVVLASCVSSPMLGAVARELGVRYEETLTGFKWIANRAIELAMSDALRFVFGYEEALGYTVGTVVRDKDGISAALVLAELAAVRRAKGLTLLDELDRLARRYGLYVSAQKAVTMPGSNGLAQIAAAMTALRQASPRRVGPLAVVATSDFLAGVRVAADGATTRLSLPPTDMVVLELDGGSRIIARPSGTEPKIKIYFDVREEAPEGEALERAHARALARVGELSAAFSAIVGLA